MMKILIGCEFSGIVRTEFEKKGHDVLSCDLLDSDLPGNHYKGYIQNILYDGWDMLIAFPPCTYLSYVGEHLFKNNYKRWFKRFAAMELFCELYESNIPKICIENPMGFPERVYPSYQIIDPYQFGADYKKKTCLWLKGLKPLIKTNDKAKPKDSLVYLYRDWKTRSITYPGVAKAMADQWS